MNDSFKCAPVRPKGFKIFYRKTRIKYSYDIVDTNLRLIQNIWELNASKLSCTLQNIKQI